MPYAYQRRRKAEVEKRDQTRMKTKPKVESLPVDEREYEVPIPVAGHIRMPKESKVRRDWAEFSKLLELPNTLESCDAYIARYRKPVMVTDSEKGVPRSPRYYQQ